MRHAERDAAHDAAWRDPADVVAQWSDAGAGDAALLRAVARGAWWETLARAGVTLLVSREYEHLVLALACAPRPSLSYLRLPHPSGIAHDAARKTVYVAATRNPNAVVTLARASGGDLAHRLAPVRTAYLPGRTYVHDLAMVGGRLHANAVGRNAVVAIDDDGRARTVWWPRSVDRDGGPIDDRNVLQLNSIAAGENLAASFFSASAEREGRYRPGHARFPVDRRGVVFSGATREPVVRGLTRPHSARLHDGVLWVDDSGYGAVGIARDGRFDAIARLPGWTRGLAFAGGVAFVGTSRVIPRFAQYAPGLDVSRSRCAIHALDVRTGRVLGSLAFPAGNQIFAIEAVPASWTTAFPFAPKQRASAARDFFFGFHRDDA